MKAAQLWASRANPKKRANLGEGSSTARVVDDLRDDSTNVVVPLGVVHKAVLGSALAVGDVGFEDTPTTLAARSNDATHLRPEL